MTAPGEPSTSPGPGVAAGHPAQRRTCIIVPAFNEGPSVAKVVAAIHQAVPGAGVVVIDDGSSDDTSHQARTAGATVITLPVNLGIGGAMQTGYRYALRRGYDIAIQVDGDGQHEPDEIALLLEPLLAGRADMVVGSRWLGRGGYEAPPSRRVGMRILSTLVRWRTKVPVTDTTSGFRAVGHAGLELFAATYPTDFPEVESLVMATNHGLRLQEVGVHMNEREHGRSSIAGLRSAYYMMRVTTVLVVDRLNRDI